MEMRWILGPFCHLQTSDLLVIPKVASKKRRYLSVSLDFFYFFVHHRAQSLFLERRFYWAMRQLFGIRPTWQRISLALLLWCVGYAASAQSVENLRLWSGPDGTRVVFDLDQSVDYRIIELDDPHRVVVDLQNTRLAGELALPSKKTDLITNVRHGIRQGTDLRVVFDLGARAKPQSFLLTPAGAYGHRLVVDLVPEDVVPAAERVRQAVQTAQTGERKMIVAIDAGHGGEDPGAIGPSGSYEKTVVLEIARELKKRLDAMPGVQGVLLRTGDYFIPLGERYQRARQAEADLFISIHADAFRDFRVRGSSVYILSQRGASSEAARMLAKSENEADLIGGVKLDRGDDVLSSVLLDLSQSATLEYSALAAENLLNQLGTVGRRHRKRVESANFVVLRSPDVPSVLVEVGFISNPQDEQNLNSSHHRKKVANALAQGIHQHFMRTAPQGTWYAAHRSEQRYIVQQGDTLGVIAQQHRVSVNDLRASNNIDGDLIRPGAVLVIPAGS